MTKEFYHIAEIPNNQQIKDPGSKGASLSLLPIENSDTHDYLTTI